MRRRRGRQPRETLGKCEGGTAAREDGSAHWSLHGDFTALHIKKQGLREPVFEFDLVSLIQGQPVGSF